MRTVRFTSKDKHEKAFVAALRKNVNDYFTKNNISPKGNWRMYLKSAIMLSLFILPLVAIITVPMSAWMLLPLGIIMGIGMAGVGMSVMHDANHGAYSHKPWVNKMMGNTMYLLGANVFNWKISHNFLHHVYTNINGIDGDINSRGPIRFSEHAPLKPFHKYQYIHAFFVYGILTIYKFINDFMQMFQFDKNGIMKMKNTSFWPEMLTLIATKAAYLFMIIGLPIIYSDFAWWQILLCYLTMHFTAGFILGVVFQLAHVVEDVDFPLDDEKGVIEEEWLVHEVKTTCNFARENRLLNWYIGGLNFQVEHHLFPQICHIHYTQISPIVERTVKEFGYPYHVKPTFRSAVVSHMRKLKELGRPVAA